MGWRQTELAHFGDRLTWLDDSAAARTYTQAIEHNSHGHYGLKSSNFRQVERLDVDTTSDGGADWLTARVGSGRVRIVFGRLDVCLVDASFFLANWQDMFCPSRDDVIVLPEMGDWVLFYCHEDEFEYGIRSPA
ncbi:MAG: hypothetical protein ACKVT0_10845 [Planctomycetaceae bacterium]